MIITSDTEFFERLGWKKGEETPYAVMEFFNRCYEFALQEFGYHGTAKIYCLPLYTWTKKRRICNSTTYP